MGPGIRIENKMDKKEEPKLNIYLTTKLQQVFKSIALSQNYS